MFKAMVLLKRHPGLSMRQFIDHFETRHVPVIMKYQTRMKRYIRHYLHASPYPLDGSVVEPEYDVLAELWFDDRQAYAEGMALMAEPETKNILSEGEALLLDSGKSRIAFVEEHESELPWMRSAAPRDGSKDLKCMVLLKRKPGMTIDAFIDYYETRHAKLGVKYSPTLSRYRRHFLRPAPHPWDGSVVEPAYDVATEVCFPDKAAQIEAARIMALPEVNAIIEADEANFLDRETRRLVIVEDRETELPLVVAGK